MTSNQRAEWTISSQPVRDIKFPRNTFQFLNDWESECRYSRCLKRFNIIGIWFDLAHMQQVCGRVRENYRARHQTLSYFQSYPSLHSLKCVRMFDYRRLTNIDYDLRLAATVVYMSLRQFSTPCTVLQYKNYHFKFGFISTSKYYMLVAYLP